MNGLNKFELGLIEGFYGAPWSWEIRSEMVDFLKENNYSYYIYAPKADRKLREEWHLKWSDDEFNQVSNFRNRCKKSGIKFGIGLSPYELYLNWNDQGKELLKNKIEDINRLNPEILWVLFDDMEGNRDSMASIQIEISHFIKSFAKVNKIAICPTYYSYDPILKALFGDMPRHYLDELGENLDKDIDIIWTGPDVCSKEITADHIKEVTTVLKRKPLLWDNYPVNDSPRLTPFLFLNGFSKRDPELKELCSAHTINPMVQPYLSQLPLATLPDLYSKESYNFIDSTSEHGRKIFGNELWEVLKDDIEKFEKRGMGPGKHPEVLEKWTKDIEGATYFDHLSKCEKSKLIRDRELFDFVMENHLKLDEIQELINKYEKFPGEYSREIIDWLKGEYSFDPKILENN